MTTPTIIAGASDAAIADWIAQRLGVALTKGPAVVALPGGATPFPILRDLVQRPLDWPRVTCIPTDDRLVAEDHPASNIGKLRALLEPAGACVRALAPDMAVPHLALCWLGMGTDGHVASLFPNTDPQAEDPQMVRRLPPDPLPPEAPFDRITLTIPALIDADEILFVARGEEKAGLFSQAARRANDLPVARLLAAAQCPVTCFT